MMVSSPQTYVTYSKTPTVYYACSIGVIPAYAGIQATPKYVAKDREDFHRHLSLSDWRCSGNLAPECLDNRACCVHPHRRHEDRHINTSRAEYLELFPAARDRAKQADRI